MMNLVIVYQQIKLDIPNYHLRDSFREECNEKVVYLLGVELLHISQSICPSPKAKNFIPRAVGHVDKFFIKPAVSHDSSSSPDDQPVFSHFYVVKRTC